MQKELSPDDPYPERAASVHTLRSYAPIPGGATQGRSTSYAGRALSRHYSRADSAMMDRAASQAILALTEKQTASSNRKSSRVETSDKERIRSEWADIDRAGSVNSGAGTLSPYANLETHGTTQTNRRQEQKTNITDKVPTLTEMFYAGGSFTGATAGGWFDDIGGYSFACTIVATMSVLWALIYASAVFLPECKQDGGETGKERLERLQQHDDDDSLVMEQDDVD